MSVRGATALPPIVLALCLSAAGCAHRPASRPVRVAVVPLDAVGLPRRDVESMQQTIGRQVASRADVPVVSGHRIDAAVRSLTACQGQTAIASIDCAVAVGRQVAASDVVVGMVGGLSGTYVLRVKVVSVQRAAVGRSVEETVFGRPDRLDAAMGRLAVRLFDLRQPRPWYARWWLWAMVSAAATAAVVVPLVVRRDDPYQDFPLPP